MRTYTADEVRELLRREVAKAGGQSAWAAKHGINRQYIYQVLKGYRPFGQMMLDEVGIERAYVKKALDNERV